MTRTDSACQLHSNCYVNARVHRTSSAITYTLAPVFSFILGPGPYPWCHVPFTSADPPSLLVVTTYCIVVSPLSERPHSSIQHPCANQKPFPSRQVPHAHFPTLQSEVPSSPRSLTVNLFANTPFPSCPPSPLGRRLNTSNAHLQTPSSPHCSTALRTNVKTKEPRPPPPPPPKNRTPLLSHLLHSWFSCNFRHRDNDCLFSQRI
ncbi:hypothetical protein BJY52DRAFT_738033 [Lactarius psammicola]|nr:hypothetical protein BJY52DRAFT_738033 [Lactarius psammicola]